MLKVDPVPEEGVPPGADHIYEPFPPLAVSWASAPMPTVCDEGLQVNEKVISTEFDVEQPKTLHAFTV